MNTLVEATEQVRAAFEELGGAIRCCGISVEQAAIAFRTLSRAGIRIEDKEEKSLAVFIPIGKVRKLCQ